MEYREFLPDEKNNVTNVIKLMLAKARKIHLEKHPNSHIIGINLDYAEAFGMIRLLAVLGYGYIGPDIENVSAFNLKNWFKTLCEEICNEMNFSNKEIILDKYRKLANKSYGY